MRRSKLMIIAGTFLAALSTRVWADTTARPGTVNYVEGQAAMGGQALDAKSVGTEIRESHALTTLNGKVEILLTPGVFLRMGPNSSATLVAASLTNTQVQMDQGHAIIEVDQIFPENHLQVVQGGFTIEMQKKGLYDFDAADHLVRVLDGEAAATNGAHRIELKSGHELNSIATGEIKAHGFDKKSAEGDLYNWSRLRSSYLAEANVSEARAYAGGAGFYGAGWYWNPWYSAYTFIPGDGFFYSPFGWGFYSPFLVYRAPFFGFHGGGYRTFAGYAPPAAFVSSYRSGAVMSARPAFRSMGGGFRGGRR
jgi:hypothetical protein